MAKKETKIEKLLSEYDIESYRDFSSTIKFLLEKLLKRHGFNKQTVTFRVKDRVSLKKNLKKDGLYLKLKHITQIDDLAGCRIIFYIKKDIDRIIPLFRDDFKIVKPNKLHYSDKGYNANHLYVALKKNRLKLSEYSAFADLKCEIQLTTVLHHAWSELEHDIIYKPDEELEEIYEYDQKSQESIKKRFEEIMEKQIMEAQHGFDFIFEEIEKLRQGKKIFDRSFITSIVNEESNNNLYETLKLFLKFIDEYGDKTPKDIDTVKIMRATLEKSASLPKEPIKTVLGDFAGYDLEAVADIVLDILNRLRYSRPEDVFNLLVDLVSDKNIKNKKKIFETVGKITAYTFWPKEKKIYFHPQLQVLDIIEKWDAKTLSQNSLITAETGKHILSPSYEGNEWTSKALTLHRGSLPASEIVIKIRKRMLDILFGAYKATGNLHAKLALVQSLYVATETPHDSNYGEDVEKMVFENVEQIIKFYLSIIAKSDFEIIKKIEEQLRWFKKRFDRSKLEKLDELSAIISSNTDYELYRLFVGYNHGYFEDFDYAKAEEARNKRIVEIIQEITKENYHDWLERLLGVIKNYPEAEDPGEYIFFNRFLNELAKTNPEVGLRLIDIEEFGPFLIHIIAGIWQSSQKAKAKQIIRGWIANGKHVSISAFIFSYVGEFDIKLINEILEKAKDLKDINALNNIIRSVGQLKDEKSKELKKVFLSAIRELTVLENTWWVHNTWYNAEILLSKLNESEWDILLENLILVSNINYESEEILSLIAQNYPKKFIQFFEKRVKIKKNKRDDRYDAIPFDFAPRQTGKLIELPDATKKIFIDEIFKWFRAEDWLNYWEGAHLLQNLFPSFDPYLEAKLIEILKSKKKNKTKIAVYVLRAYKGEKFLYDVCKEFIKQFPTSKRYKNEIFVILSQTGVVSGEYGFVNAYEGRIADIESWKSDKSKIIQRFAKDYEEYLQERISSERKRADDEVDHRQRAYGEK
jgi:ppGpp synthetase/RelA/SpoT-type nucleotidyltranferase